MDQEQTENKYLLLGFWEFAILSTLVVVFFPWSLLFSLVFTGMDSTKLLIFALLHDAIKTLRAIIAIIISIVIIIYAIVWLFG